MQASDAPAGVHFTIHVRERAVACALPRDVLGGGSPSAAAQARALASYEGLGATLARLAHDDLSDRS